MTEGAPPDIDVDDAHTPIRPRVEGWLSTTLATDAGA
jgi:hypothetical protein